MLCQKCHKNLATVRYTEVVDAKVTDVHLCAECLAEYDQDTASGFRLSGAAPTPSNLAAAYFMRDTLGATERACPSCRTDLVDVLKSGKVGCNVCYETFSEPIVSLLAGLHAGASHRGKTPNLDDARARTRGELQTKRMLLKNSIEKENYEEAATLRDRIRALEVGLGAQEPGQD